MRWQVTATTVRCDYVSDFATILVRSDLTAKCSYVSSHEGNRGDHKRLKNCQWPDCSIVQKCHQEMTAI